MYKIIGSDGKEYGPTSESELRTWIAEKRVSAATPAQRLGETEWKPLSTFSEFADLFGVPDPDAFAAEILRRDVAVEIGGSISRSWKLYKEQFGLVFPATLLITIVSIAASAIPYMGALVGWFFNGVLFGGLYWFFLKLIRREKAELGDAFAGFQRSFPQLMLSGAVTNALIFLGFCMGGIPFLISFVPAIWEIARSGNPDPNVLLQAVGVGAVIGLFVGVALAFSLYVIWVFTLPLVIDKGLGFWQAMELSRKVVTKALRSVLGLVIVSGLIGASGILLCCVGVFFTMPISFGALAFAYEDIFGSHMNPVHLDD